MILGGVLLVGGGLAVAGGAAALAGASAYAYKRRQKKNKRRKKREGKEQTVFGEHLEDVTSLSENELPLIFDLCITWLENNGLEADNLFCLSRALLRAGELAQMYDTCKHISCSEALDGLLTETGAGSEKKPFSLEKEDPQDVALLLLQYISDLPEPLCTFVLYEDFVQTYQEGNVEKWIEAMRNQLLQLPDVNLRVVKRLITFLSSYCEEQQRVCNAPLSNSIERLSKVFGRLLFHSWETEPGDYQAQVVCNSLFSRLLTNHERVFATTGASVASYEGSVFNPARMGAYAYDRELPGAPGDALDYKINLEKRGGDSLGQWPNTPEAEAFQSDTDNEDDSASFSRFSQGFSQSGIQLEKRSSRMGVQLAPS